MLVVKTRLFGGLTGARIDYFLVIKGLRSFDRNPAWIDFVLSRCCHRLVINE